LEDQERRVGASDDGSPPLKKKPQRENRFTVMIMGSLGRVRSFEISPRVVFWTALFLVLYIPFSIFVINRYFVLRSVHEHQSAKLSVLEKDASMHQKTLLRSREHIAFLEEYIDSLEKGEVQDNPSNTAKEPETASAGAATVGASTTQAQEEPLESAGIVHIEDMVISKQDSKLEIEFRLVNTQQGEEAVGGYVHIIAKQGEGDNPQLRTFPYEKLVNGLPENYRRGQLFLIKWFKPVQGRFDLGPGSDLPSSIRVLVYDRSGVLLLEDEFEVQHES
jgi:hypothetical protein